MTKPDRENRNDSRSARERTQHSNGGIKRHKCGGGYRIIRKKLPQ